MELQVLQQILEEQKKINELLQVIASNSEHSECSEPPVGFGQIGYDPLSKDFH